MKHKLTFFIFSIGLLFFSQYAQASSDIDNRWNALISFAKISKERLQTNCPNYKTPIDAWIKQHPNEVSAFLALDEVKKINPSLADLGLNVADFQANTFQNAYWSWFEKSGLSKITLTQYAPHFPVPIANDFSSVYKAKYEAAISDWTKLFPKEVEWFINEPSLAKLNRFYQKESLIETGEEFKGLDVEKGVYPEQSYYDSGNPTLDTVRLEMYLKNWYFTFDRENYFKRYEPSMYEAYREKKIKADQEPDKASH